MGCPPQSHTGQSMKILCDIKPVRCLIKVKNHWSAGLIQHIELPTNFSGVVKTMLLLYREKETFYTGKDT